jgi:outer membrane biosynthesis protein TonB
MSKLPAHGTLLEFTLYEERYGRAFVFSIGIHLAGALLFLAAPYLFPQPIPIVLGTGPGGGTGGAPYTVGVADDLGGGAGMIKPSLIPQPPALPEEKPADKETAVPLPKPPAESEKPAKEAAVPLPNTVEPQKPPAKKEKTEVADTQVIPTAPQPGAGGTGGLAGGSGGGRGAGVGVSLGTGSGGLGDLWYARMVEQRIGSNWIRPASEVGRIEIVYSFFITNDGTIRDIKKEKSSGNDLLDLTAERAIRASTSPPLPPLPPQLRGRPVQFMAQFIHPPNP